MHRLFPRIMRTDPSAFTTAFAAWAVVVGIALVLPGDYFAASPIWEALENIHRNDAVWGWAMIGDGCILYIGSRALAIPYRCALTLFSAVLWGILGATCLYNGWRHGGYFPIVGLFSLCCAIQAFVASEQWVWMQNKWE